MHRQYETKMDQLVPCQIFERDQTGHRGAKIICVTLTCNDV